jgi:hypothetical protein
LNASDTFWLGILAEIQLAFILFSMVIFLTIPKQGRRDYVELGLIIFLSSITSTAAEVGYYLYKTPGNFLSNIYHILNLPLIVLLYKKRIHWKTTNAIAYTIIISYLAFALINFFFIQGPQKFNSFTPALEAVLTIIISVTYFYVLIQQLPTQSITKLPMFWINSAMLIYRAGTFLSYLSADYLINVLGNNLIAYWFANHSLGLVFYAMLSYSMFLIRAEYSTARKERIL